MDHKDEQGDLGLQKKGGRGSDVVWVAMARTMHGQSTGQAEQGMGDSSAMCLPLNPRSAYSKKIQS